MRNALWLAAWVVLCTSSAAAQDGASGIGGSDSSTGGTRSDVVRGPRIDELVPGNGWFLVGSNGMTFSGGVSIRRADEDPSMPVVQLSESREVVDGLFAFKPVEPLPPGEYVLDAPTPADYQLGRAVTVVEEMLLEPPVLSSAPEAWWQAHSTEQVRCERFVDGEWEEMSISVRAVGHVYVNLHLSTPTPALASQFLYRAFVIGSDERGEWSHPDGIDVGPFETQADEYCFGVERIALATSEVSVESSVTPTCVAHGELPSLAEREIEIPEYIEGVWMFECDRASAGDVDAGDVDARVPANGPGSPSRPTRDATCSALPAHRGTQWPAWLLIALVATMLSRRTTARAKKPSSRVR